MNNKVELPASFTCEMPDDALAPNTPKGTPVIFDRSDQHPAAGIGVLVQDRHGTRHIRTFRPGIGGHWVAWARNEHYLSLESEKHGLLMLAVARHRMLDGSL